MANYFGDCKIYRYEYRKEHTIRERVKVNGKWKKFGGGIPDDLNEAARRTIRAKMEQLPEKVIGVPDPAYDCVEDENPIIKRSTWRYKRFESIAHHNNIDYPVSFRIELRFMTTSGQLDAGDEGDKNVDDFTSI
jgi:hypothetical protein